MQNECKAFVQLTNIFTARQPHTTETVLSRAVLSICFILAPAPNIGWNIIFIFGRIKYPDHIWIAESYASSFVDLKLLTGISANIRMSQIASTPFGTALVSTLSTQNIERHSEQSRSVHSIFLATKH